MADTPVLTLPLIAASQAQKHVTHNEALAILDVIVQLAVISRTIFTPPTTPTLGDRYIVGPSATGAWAGQEGNIATWNGTAWLFTVPRSGWQAFVIAEKREFAFDGAAWVRPSRFRFRTEPASYATVSDDFSGDLLIQMDVTSANTLTVAPGMTGDEPLEVAQAGTGQTTIAAGAGVILLAAGGALRLRARHSVAKIAKVATNTYRVWGDLVP